MSDLHREMLKSSLPPLPEKFPASRFSGMVPKRRTRDYTPVEWDKYFEESHDILVGENSFRLYTLGKSGPLILLLHGGGHSALSWAVFALALNKLCECQIVAIDLRGHGHTKSTDDTNFDADVLASDVADALKAYMEELPPVVMLGHSMGGAIAVHIGVQQLIPTLKGLAVIDVVEGTALESLSSMVSFLRSRPNSFKSMEQAIEWSIRAGQLKNTESAKVSMPGQLKRIEKPSDIEKSTNISEEPHSDSTYVESNTKEDEYTWRVDLFKTEPFWKGWFQDMSSLFLSCPVPKLLILAGIDRLDKALTIGQMQGKFQMQILANCGHMVHEDKPDSVAEIVANFLERQKLTKPRQGVKRHMPSC